MSDQQPQPGAPGWGPPPPPAQPRWVPPPPPAQPPSWDPPPGATIQQPPPRKPRSWVTWVIALAAFGAGLAIGTAGNDSDPQAAKTVTVTSLVDREVLSETTVASLAPPGTLVPSTWSDGVYEVGAEIRPGTYKTRAKGDDCYWARLADPDGDKILANHMGAGPMTLRVRSTDKFIELDGGCVWLKVG